MKLYSIIIMCAALMDVKLRIEERRSRRRVLYISSMLLLMRGSGLYISGVISSDMLYACVACVAGPRRISCVAEILYII